MREGRFLSLHEALKALEDAKWPGVRVDSQTFGLLPFDDRLRQMAIGYLDSARDLCEMLGQNPEKLTWPRASVVCFCLRHAVECFLKACIIHRAPKIRRCSHEIAELHKQYAELYPDAAFVLQTPWSQDMEEAAQAFGIDLAIEDFEHHHDQVYRYVAGRHGQSPKGVYNFAPGVWLWMIGRITKDFDRIWENILESEGHPTTG